MNWMQATENVADIAKDKFIEVLNYDIYTYLNFLAYSSYKQKKLEAELKKNKKKWNILI